MTILLWIGIVIVGLVLVLVVLPILWFRFANTAPEGIDVDVTGPSLVPVAQTFDIVVTITNRLDRPRTLRSLDLEASLLKGFAIELLEPKPDDISSMLGTTAHHYKVMIPPQGSITVKLRCRALARGEYYGTVLTYVDSVNYRSEDKWLSITIET